MVASQSRGIGDVAPGSYTREDAANFVVMKQIRTTNCPQRILCAPTQTALPLFRVANADLETTELKHKVY